MSVTVEWASPRKHRLILTFHAPWTWNEYEQISPAIEHAFHSTDNTVDFIIDLRDAGEMPDDVLNRLRDAYADATVNLGGYIFIGADANFKTLLEVADNYYSTLGGRLNYIFVDTLEDAVEALNWRDAVGQ